jgi:hypothetical protein
MCCLLLSLWSKMNMIWKHAYRILNSISLSLSLPPSLCPSSPLSLIHKCSVAYQNIYWLDSTSKRKNLGKTKIEIYSCRRFSRGTWELSCNTLAGILGAWLATCSPQPHYISWIHHLVTCNSIHKLVYKFVSFSVDEKVLLPQCYLSVMAHKKSKVYI